MNRPLICTFLFCLLPSLIADLFSKHLNFGFDNEKHSVQIPFKNHNNLIIIQLILDEESKLNLILDIGIRYLVLFDHQYLPQSIINSFEVKFSGAGNPKPIKASVSVNHTL